MTARFQLLVFSLIAGTFCLLLSFRPIPAIDNQNDTGRYVAALHQSCAGSISSELANREISLQLFYVAALPACIVKSDGVFLFQVAFLVPLMFLLFSSWRSGTLMWACGLLVSVYGLELMTNAMRQGLAMLLFFGALSLARKQTGRALLLAAVGTLAHTSVLAFLPLILWVSKTEWAKITPWIGVASALFVTAVGGLAYESAIREFFSSIEEWHIFYRAIYADELKASFLLYMVLPLYFVYGIRRVFERTAITGLEGTAVAYSTILMLASYAVYPAITYRFAIFAVALQVFLVSISDRQGFKTGCIALAGFIVHLSVMLLVSNHFDVLVHG